MYKNELYPIFLKVAQLNILIVGGGKVAYEKLSFLLKSSPNAQVVLVALDFTKDILELTKKYNVLTKVSPYNRALLQKQHLVIAATNNVTVNEEVFKDAKQRQLLVNVADTPNLCDFYLGGIVTKGNVKIAISTNGKSPTISKRLRQFFEEVIPEDISETVENLESYRKSLKDDFYLKIITLNKVTKNLINNI